MTDTKITKDRAELFLGFKPELLDPFRGKPAKLDGVGAVLKTGKDTSNGVGGQTMNEKVRSSQILIGPHVGEEVLEPETFEEFREQVLASERRNGFDRNILTLFFHFCYPYTVNNLSFI